MRVQQDHFVCYAWPEYEGYVIEALCPDAQMHIAEPEHSVEQARAGLPPSGGVFLFHLDCTVTDRFPLVRAELVSTILATGGRVLNAKVTDIISKRNVQSCLVY